MGGSATFEGTAAVAASRLTEFVRFCATQTGRSFDTYAAFDEFSVAEFRRFWDLFLTWSGLLVEGSPEPVCTSDACEDATFFPELRLSYAENLLRVDDPEEADRVALVAHHAFRPPDRLTRAELRDRVRAVAAHLRELGVGPGDRVAAVVGNNAEAVIAGLASATVGATFSSAAPDMGAPAILSRFEQLDPAVLVAGERAAELLPRLPSVRVVVVPDDAPLPRRDGVEGRRLADMLTHPGPDDGEWQRFPFNHPLFVLFTSGTTGAPKCIVHGAGGTLLEHAKEHRLHTDLGPGDRLFFHTSAAWMMWNWQLSALASGSSIVVYDGPLTGPARLWELVAEERVTVFGTSPPYLQLCEDNAYSPRRELGLGDLRAVLSTGSILGDWQFDWVGEHVGPLPVQSISGGTDIVGCFVLGNPNRPVRSGWLQCRSLGMDVQALDGELVCRNPFPSRPLHLLGDDGSRFHDAYFAQNPGVWTHGDLIEFDAHGNARMRGRSDGVVNVQGVRIGPAEIYRALHGVPEVREAMAVEQRASDVRGRSRLLLLVVLREGTELDGRLSVRIRREVARATSPLHVPEIVVAVDELPVTHSGKRSERAASDAINGVPLGNADALANPGSLDLIRTAVAAELERRQAVQDAGAPPADGTTEQRLRTIWESVLGIAPLHPDDNFFDLGGTSLAAVQLLVEIHERLGIELPLSTLLHAPTPAAMAGLIEGTDAARVPSLVLLRTGSDDRPVFLIHSLYGDVLSMRPLALRLDVERPVYGLQARGLNPDEEPQTSVEEMADSYIEIVRSAQPAGPYVLAGHSFGGLVAFEMARRFERLGERVEWLGLIDSDLHHSCLPGPARARWAARKTVSVLRSLRAEGLRGVRHYARRAAERVTTRRPLIPPPAELELPPRMRRLEEVGWEAFNAYCPSPYGGSATFFRADDRREDLGDPIPVWSRMVEGGLTVEALPGGHADMIGEPIVGVLAERMARHISAPGG